MSLAGMNSIRPATIQRFRLDERPINVDQQPFHSLVERYSFPYLTVTATPTNTWQHEIQRLGDRVHKTITSTAAPEKTIKIGGITMQLTFTSDYSPFKRLANEMA